MMGKGGLRQADVSPSPRFPYLQSMFPPLPRPEVLALRMSKIREVANAGLGRDDILAFWFGESDQPTPDFIREPAARALLDGRTYYMHNLGRADVRESLSAYLTRLHGTRVGTERLAIVSAGVNAIQLAAQAVISPGDRCVVVGPIWPNVPEIPKILSASVKMVPLEPAQGRWRLDLDRLLDALTPDTKLLILNSPNNPTGWMLPEENRAPNPRGAAASTGILLTLAKNSTKRLDF